MAVDSVGGQIEEEMGRGGVGEAAQEEEVAGGSR